MDTWDKSRVFRECSVWCDRLRKRLFLFGGGCQVMANTTQNMQVTSLHTRLHKAAPRGKHISPHTLCLCREHAHTHTHRQTHAPKLKQPRVNRVIVQGRSWKGSRCHIATKRGRTGRRAVQTLLPVSVEGAYAVNKALTALQIWTLGHTRTHWRTHNLYICLLCPSHSFKPNQASSACSPRKHAQTWQRVYPISSNNEGPGDVTVPGTGAQNSS